MASQSDIHLYTAQTPNGIKVSILLEELGLSYQTTTLDLSKSTQKEEWFLKINPNGRVPAITDKFTDGSTIRVFESGSIMQYLVDRYDTENKVSYPHGTKEYYETNSWLFFQNAGLGPMQGQANHFTRYASEHIPYGISRYQNETRRLYKVLDTELAASKSGFLVGDRLTVADISSWGWVCSATWAGVNIDEFPSLKKWLFTLLERPGFEKGRHVPSEHKAFEYFKMSEEEMNAKAEAGRAWVQAAMKEEAKK